MPRSPKKPPPDHGNGRGPIASRIRDSIRSSGLSAYEIADRAGIDRALISRFLSGRRSLSLDSADAIAGALGLRLVEPERRARARRIPGEPLPAGPDNTPDA